MMIVAEAADPAADRRTARDATLTTAVLDVGVHGAGSA